MKREGVICRRKISAYERVMDVLPAIIKAVKGIDGRKIILCGLWHPCDQDSLNYYELFRQTGIAYFADQQARGLMTTPEIYLAADLVVGVTSTETLRAVYLRRPTLNLIFPGGVNWRNILAPREMTTVPTVASGASLLAESPEEVIAVIKAFFGESKAATTRRLEENQKKFFNLNGKGTQRVVKVLL